MWSHADAVCSCDHGIQTAACSSEERHSLTLLLMGMGMFAKPLERLPLTVTVTIELGTVHMWMCGVAVYVPVFM